MGTYNVMYMYFDWLPKHSRNRIQCQLNNIIVVYGKKPQIANCSETHYHKYIIKKAT